MTSPLIYYTNILFLFSTLTSTYTLFLFSWILFTNPPHSLKRFIPRILLEWLDNPSSPSMVLPIISLPRFFPLSLNYLSCKFPKEGISFIQRNQLSMGGSWVVRSIISSQCWWSVLRGLDLETEQRTAVGGGRLDHSIWIGRVGAGGEREYGPLFKCQVEKVSQEYSQPVQGSRQDPDKWESGMNREEA